jgi:hypothetical protein
MSADLKSLGVVLSESRIGTGLPEYSLLDVSGVSVRKGPQDSRLVIRENGALVDWVLLEWAASEADGSNPSYGMIAHGNGVGDALREARHTYFGDDGYVFYLNAEILTWGIGQLKEWFDFK